MDVSRACETRRSALVRGIHNGAKNMTKTALITGASGGIGRAFAVALANKGWTVTAAARTQDKLSALVRELGEGHEYLAVDLASTAGQDAVIDRLRQKHFDLLINNAGAGVLGEFHEVPVERTLAMMHLNLDAVVRLAHAYLAGARAGDALINLSSTLAFVPMARSGVYCASKSFVTAFSESLWYEQKPRGVYVMGLCPGPTRSDFQTNAGGREEDLPQNMFQTAEVVVERALTALRRRSQPTVFTAAHNTLFSAFGRLVPRKLLANIAGKMSA